MKAHGHTPAHAASEVFHVTRACICCWLKKKYRPKSEHRDIARDVYGVPLEAWDTSQERARRLARLATPAPAPAPAVPPPPASRPKARRKLPARAEAKDRRPAAA